MASEQLCGRSANCGACAQICRNHFSVSADLEVKAALSPIPESGFHFQEEFGEMKNVVAFGTLVSLGMEDPKNLGRIAKSVLDLKDDDKKLIDK